MAYDPALRQRLRELREALASVDPASIQAQAIRQQYRTLLDEPRTELTVEEIPAILELFTNGIVASFEPLAIASYIKGRIDISRQMGLSWEGQGWNLSPSQWQAVKQAYGTMNPYLKGASRRFRWEIQAELSRAMWGNEHPTEAALRLLYRTEGPEEVLQEQAFDLVQRKFHWFERVARTEASRLENLGRLDKIDQEEGDRGITLVTPHVGSCAHCRRLIELRVFNTQQLRKSMYANYGKPPREWVAALPQHPHCRHSAQYVLEDQRAWLATEGHRPGNLPPQGVLIPAEFVLAS